MGIRSFAIGIGVVFRVEEDQGLGVADLEPGSSELVTKCAGQVRVGEPCPPCIKELAHPLGIVGMPDNGVPVGVQDKRPPPRAEDSIQLGECVGQVSDVLIDLYGYSRVEGRIGER